jgi:hypothetical protein
VRDEKHMQNELEGKGIRVRPRCIKEENMKTDYKGICLDSVVRPEFIWLRTGTSYEILCTW